jgi:hypothetical protein
MSTKKPAPPSQHEVERQFRELLDRGDIDDLASWLDVPYDTLSKQLNPGNTNKSDVYKAVRVLWALGQMDEGKAWKALDLIAALVFPTADAAQLASRIENDARRLREMLTGGAP